MQGRKRGQMMVAIRCQLFSNIVVGINDFVRAVAKEEFPLDFRRRFGYDVFCSQILQQGSNFEGGLEIVSDCHDADIERGNIHCGETIGIHAICNEGARILGGQGVDDGFVFVYDHHFVAHAQKSFAQRLTEFSHTYQ